MGNVMLHPKVKLIIGMISGEGELFNEIGDLLLADFGNIDLETDIIDFSYTDYYKQEMGKKLKRKFLSFKELIFPDKISDIKLITNDLEKRFLNIAGGRRINLDPGYVTKAKLVLATTKDYQHRVYLKDDIYTEVTLRFTKDGFRGWEWTYPDYKTDEYVDFFNNVRQLYTKQLNNK